ncbi:hypothetical protein B0H21DRAFT_722803 [Amylocystis lapponica]|nr:hypothetical protein B0H21DRAFT_722803 [Amylocystis lapponica]
MLALSTSLKSLELYTLRIPFPASMLGLLSEIPSTSHLQDLRVAFYYITLKKIDWLGVSRLLSADHFCDLATVTFVFFLERVSRSSRSLWNAKYRRKLERSRPAVSLGSLTYVAFEFRQTSLDGRKDAIYTVAVDSSNQVTTWFAVDPSTCPG